MRHMTPVIDYMPGTPPEPCQFCGSKATHVLIGHKGMTTACAGCSAEVCWNPKHEGLPDREPLEKAYR